MNPAAKYPIGPFVELGRILQQELDEGRLDPVIRRATEANCWFTAESVAFAIRAICNDMLQPELLETWLRPYQKQGTKTVRRVGIIMAGNIPLVGFFDLLCVLASWHACRVKPSSKDTVLIGYVVDLLRTIDPAIPLRMAEQGERPDAVIATGSDNANRYFRMLFGGIPSLLRGSRQSVAVLSGRETAAELSGLEEDIFSYSGLGCRNVSLLFLPRGYLPELRCTALNEKYRRNYLRERALLRMRRMPFVDLDGAVLCEDRSFPAALSRIHYTFYDSLADVEAWLAANDDRLQCVVSQCVRHSRRVAFGRAQHPGLTDYADDVDTMRFLGTI